MGFGEGEVKSQKSAGIMESLIERLHPAFDEKNQPAALWPNNPYFTKKMWCRKVREHRKPEREEECAVSIKVDEKCKERIVEAVESDPHAYDHINMPLRARFTQAAWPFAIRTKAKRIEAVQAAFAAELQVPAVPADADFFALYRSSAAADASALERAARRVVDGLAAEGECFTLRRI